MSTGQNQETAGQAHTNCEKSSRTHSSSARVRGSPTVKSGGEDGLLCRRLWWNHTLAYIQPLKWALNMVSSTECMEIGLKVREHLLQSQKQSERVARLGITWLPRD